MFLIGIDIKHFLQLFQKVLLFALNITPLYYSETVKLFNSYDTPLIETGLLLYNKSPSSAVMSASKLKLDIS